MITHTLQILAVTASLGVRAVPMPDPQGVTALLTPGKVLDGCVTNYPGVHGISIQTVGSAVAASPAAAARGAAPARGGAAGGKRGTAFARSTAEAGGTAEKPRGRHAVIQIPDGQIQAAPAPEVRTPKVPAPIAQVPKSGAVAVGPAAIRGVSQIADGQIQAHGAVRSGTAGPAAGKTVTQIGDGQIQGPRKRSTLEVRQNSYPLKVTLKNGVLTDILGRIGYIADNRQLQFDAPPQAGAIFTAGFSACPDGTLALGSRNIFYSCGSSDFTNLYDTLVYPDNCREVKLFFS
ncbi:hypothetical protein HOY80DRAFT_971374 [Tuber brumale]|nr:hypothetical protein HOY80DRAFT_971374 [Tuber brumale]